MPERFTKNRAFAGLMRLGDLSLRLEQNSTVRAITDGLVNLIPLVLIGAIGMAISNLPIPELFVFLNRITGNYWTHVTNMIIFSTGYITGLAALLSVSYTLAAQSKPIQRREISVFLPMFTAFSCYVVLLVWDPVSFSATPTGQPVAAHFSSPGQNGVFFGILVAVCSIKLFSLFARFWQKLSWSQGRIVGSYSLLRNAIHIVVPILSTLLCFIAFRLLLDFFISIVDVQAHFDRFITAIATDGRLSHVILTVLMMQIMWFFGAHGSYIMHTYIGQIGAAAIIGATHPLVTETSSSAAVFTSWDYYRVFIEMGGSGTTMALLIALLMFGYSGSEKRLGRISILPVAFNANETLIYGLPVVFNLFFLAPFVLAPAVSAVVAYGAFGLGLVPPIVTQVEWTTPVLVSGYVSTGSIAGSLLQVVCVGLAFLIYSPFVIVAREVRIKHQLDLFERFKKEASNAANNEQTYVANRRDSIGEMANQFITEINMKFESRTLPFFLVYQPKTDAKRRVVGAEALLRWTHPVYGPIPPDILIELTDEADLSTPMGRWVATEALEEFARWQKLGYMQLVLSINLNPHHIFVDEEFPEFLKNELARLAIDPALVDLEITEHVAVGASKDMLRMFNRLRDLGVRLSIDDMGMGYSSLTYISDFGASVVKLDMSLIDQVDTDNKQQEIVRSVIELAKQINLAAIVEGVETQSQVEMLDSLGCRYFQGYYFAKPLLPKDFLEYVGEHGATRLLHEGKSKP